MNRHEVSTIKCYKQLSTYNNSIHIMRYIKTSDHLLCSMGCQHIITCNRYTVIDIYVLRCSLSCPALQYMQRMCYIPLHVHEHCSLSCPALLCMLTISLYMVMRKLYILKCCSLSCLADNT